jgi:3D (Asp-Asp-Asp) domain-containing protein
VSAVRGGLLLAGILALGAPVPSAAGERQEFEATAYSIEGTTASGAQTREGVVAADPDVLPLGSRIRIHGADDHSGEYVVRDTGATITGREIDIYLANDREAKRFGRRRVQVEVLRRGDGDAAAGAGRAPAPRPGRDGGAAPRLPPALGGGAPARAADGPPASSTAAQLTRAVAVLHPTTGSEARGTVTFVIGAA